MGDLFLIGLLGVFANSCATIGNNFNGSSASIKNALTLLGGLGYLMFIVGFIWAFWPYSWWQPIVMMLVTVFVSSFVTPMLQRSMAGIIVSMVVGFLSIVGTIAVIVQYFMD